MQFYQTSAKLSRTDVSSKRSASTTNSIISGEQTSGSETQPKMEDIESDWEDPHTDSTVPQSFVPVKLEGGPLKRKKQMDNESASSDKKKMRTQARGYAALHNSAQLQPKPTQYSSSTRNKQIQSTKTSYTVTYKFLFFVNAPKFKSRVEMAPQWNTVAPLCKDIILHTTKGFI